MALEPKYVVVKKDDWKSLLDRFTNDTTERSWLEGVPIKGGHFVVREQDVFAPAGLYAYAANIHSALEVIDVLDGVGISQEDRERLRALADDLTDTADKWVSSETDKKLPD